MLCKAGHTSPLSDRHCEWRSGAEMRGMMMLLLVIYISKYSWNKLSHRRYVLNIIRTLKESILLVNIMQTPVKITKQFPYSLSRDRVNKSYICNITPEFTKGVGRPHETFR